MVPLRVWTAEVFQIASKVVELHVAACFDDVCMNLDLSRILQSGGTIDAARKLKG